MKHYSTTPPQASTNQSSKQVPLFFYTLYIEGEGGGGAGEGEAIVRVSVTDVNDNRSPTHSFPNLRSFLLFLNVKLLKVFWILSLQITRLYMRQN